MTLYLVKLATGSVAQRLRTEPDEGEEIVDFVVLPRALEPHEVFSWDTKRIRTDLVAFEEGLVRVIDAEADRRSSERLAPTESKRHEYHARRW